MNNDPGKYKVAMRYAGWGTQLLILLGLAVWGGHKLDGMMGIKALLVIVFPLVVLVYSLWQLIRTLNKYKE